MKKIWSIFFTLAVLTVCQAENNLLVNGNLTKKAGKAPAGWFFDYGEGEYFQHGGPNGAGYVLFRSTSPQGKIGLRQKKLTLVPGEKYRLSCKVRTKGFSSTKTRFLLHEDKWDREFSVGGFAADSDWKEYAKDITVSQGCNSENFGVIFYAVDFQGEIAVTELQLIPLTEIAREKSFNEAVTGKKLPPVNGKNIIANSEMEGGTGDVPNYWFYAYSNGAYFPNGGPDNKGFVTFASPTVKKQSAIRQGGLTLVPGEKYRLSCKVKTKDFSARRACLLVHDFGWARECTLGDFPANTEWKDFAVDIVFSANANKGDAGIVFYLVDFQGEISVTDIKLIPHTEKGANGSRNSVEKLKNITFLDPMMPRLNAIPHGTQTLPIFLAENNGGGMVKAIVDQQEEITLRKQDGYFQLPLATSGTHTVKISGFCNGEKKAEKVLSYTIAPEAPAVPEKRLNPFTTELVNQDLTNATEFTFSVPRRTWVYFRFGNPEKMTSAITGTDAPLIDENYRRNETQRRLSAGKYTITFQTPYTGNIIIRTVPILYKYAGIDMFSMEGAGGYDLEFHKQHVFGVFNTIGARGVPENLRPYTSSLGIECMDSLQPPARKNYTAEEVQAFKKKLVSEQSPFHRSSSQWTEFDEFFWNNHEGLLVAAEAFPAIDNPYNKDLMHWFGGTGGPICPGVHHRVISEYLNAGGGRGYIAYEVYFRSKLSEKDAREEIQTELANAAKNMGKFVPDATGIFGFIYGNFHQTPFLSIDFYPGVNYKYFLDMQFNIAANNPAFNGIGMIGYWGFNYANEEISRWCCELVRHYVLEGKKEMLSQKYGYTYLLPHIKNGDFDDGLNGWTADGDIMVGEHTNFGALNELRWGANSIGDRFAVFKGHQGKTNTLKQTAGELVPGKTYYLEFITADYDDTKAGKVAPRLFPISVELPGAEIVKKFDYVDNRGVGRYGATTAKTNYRYIRFIPSSSSQELIFKDAGKDGENLLMNFVRVAPYFEE